jgi:cytochrome c55X
LLAEDIVNKSDTFLVQTILKGRKGTAMPPWQAFISKQEAFWIVKKLLRRKTQEK